MCKNQLTGLISTGSRAACFILVAYFTAALLGFESGLLPKGALGGFIGATAALGWRDR